MKQQRVLIGIISNRKEAPLSFFKSLSELADFTNYKGIKADIRFFSAVEVQLMRNNCVLYAIKENYDYIFMLDQDMVYPKDSIVKLIKHNKEFVVGSATQRNHPFFPTQYKKFKTKGFKQKDNRIFITKDNKKLIKIGGTGVVGALIKVKSFKKIKLPFFKVSYKKDGINITGSDIYFCRKWKKLGKELFLDPTVNYNHQINAFSNSFGIVTI